VSLSDRRPECFLRALDIKIKLCQMRGADNALDNDLRSRDKYHFGKMIRKLRAILKSRYSCLNLVSWVGCFTLK